jgi:hypothetical protein
MKMKNSISIVFAIILCLISLRNMGFQIKNFSTVYYDYKRGHNIISNSDPKHLIEAELCSTDTGSWQLSALKTYGSSNQLMSISFDNNCISLTEAIEAICSFYNTNKTLPTNGGTILAANRCDVTIYRLP